MTGVLAPLLLLGVLITVHEFGHFIIAKLSGVRVLVFSLGLGPRLVGFKIGETDYRISAVPFGGYVRMYGDDITEDVPPEERQRAFLYKPFLPKMAIAAAGPVANLLLPIALFFALFVGHERVADAVAGTVLPGEPAAVAGVQTGDRILKIDGHPIGAFGEIAQIVEGKPGVPLAMTLLRGDQTVELTVTPRSASAPTPFDADRKVGRLGVIAPKELPFVVVEQGSPAASAGLMTGDLVIGVNGVETKTRDALLAALDGARDAGWTLAVQRKPVAPADKDASPPALQQLSIVVPAALGVVRAPVDDRFAVTREDLAEPALVARIESTRALTVAASEQRAQRRGVSPVDGIVAHVAESSVAHHKRLTVKADRIVAIDGKPLRTRTELEAELLSAPDAVHVIGVLGNDVVGKPGVRVISFRMTPHPQRQLKSLKVLGVGLGEAYGDAQMIDRSVSPLAALSRAVDETGQTIKDVIAGFGMLFSGKVGLESLGGPITIFSLASDAASSGLYSYINLMVVISINLAVLNLLPIPILDGGHLLMFTIEAIQRRRLTVETRIKATKIGFAFIALLMVVAVGNDLLGLF